MRLSVDFSGRPAVFLDRDGTLIEDRGYLSCPSQVRFFEATVPALLRLQQRFALFIVTNQSGISLGVTTRDEVDLVNAFVAAHLADAGVRIVETYVCPHSREENCACIKPKRYFLERAVRAHGIDLPRSFAVGDHPHDVAFAADNGARGIYVLTGHGMRHRSELPAGTAVAADIGEAAEMILRGL
jgi:D-glycero-D-manno-heptose 1,7-bisphosphate phosphatase